MSQVKVAVRNAEQKYPSQQHSIVDIFGKSSGHIALPEDTHIASHMDVGDGGVQLKRRDTMWNGKHQRMTLPNG